MAQGKPNMTGYPGSKAASGVCEKIIGQMPPHHCYIELFAGHAAVWRMKKPAAQSILIDLAPSTCSTLEAYIAASNDTRSCCRCLDARSALTSLAVMQDPLTLLYVDPPYLIELRTRLLYECEFETPALHSQLITSLLTLPCMVMLSGYWSSLYAQMLQSWRVMHFPAMTRGGLREEYLWMNFPEPATLHDSRFAGQNFRERERIKRKRQRWVSRFTSMPAGERQVIAEALSLADPVSLDMAMRASTPEPTMVDRPP
jgi:DNA adenine methylase